MDIDFDILKYIKFIFKVLILMCSRKQ